MILGAQLEAVRFLTDHGDGLAAGQQHHVRVGDPVGRRHDDFVAGVQRRHEGVEDHRLAARGDVNLVGFVGQAILARELGHDGGLQFRHAVGVGVFGLAAIDGLDGRRLDVVGGVEVGLAGAQADHVAALAFQLARLSGDRQGGRRLDAGEGGGLKAGHDYPVWWMW
jgi:hypothetical protein